MVINVHSYILLEIGVCTYIVQELSIREPALSLFFEIYIISIIQLVD